MAVWYQQAGVAMLLAAPSTLHKMWNENNEEAYTAELNRLGLTEEAKVEALKSMADLRANVEFIHATSIVLKDKMWAGSEPHPTDVDAVKIMAALRRLDESWG
jgi:hypothetical protein